MEYLLTAGLFLLIVLVCFAFQGFWEYFVIEPRKKPVNHHLNFQANDPFIREFLYSQSSGNSSASETIHHEQQIAKTL